MAQARKMVNLSIEETSGVDHPAHLSEGWLVMKAANATDVADLIDTSLTTEKGVPMTVEEQLAEANAKIETLTKALDEKATAPAEPVVEEDATEALIKSLPEPVRKMLADAETTAAEAVAKAADAEQALAVEKAASADREAIEKAKASLGSLGLDPAEVGPTLRRLHETDPDLAKSVEQVLVAANAKVESADIFSEIGKSAGFRSTDSMEKATAMAKAAVAAGASPTVEQALADVWMKNPDLYAAHNNEQK